MNDELEELMLRWEASRDLAPEEVCRDCPHLAGALRQRIDAVLAMERVMGVTGHDPNATLLGTPTNDQSVDALPTIPGYEILRVIDQGGMGVVFEARQIELGRTVAVKMISAARLRPKAVARFRSEAEAAARLQHPNFVQIFEIGQINGRPFFSMEYVSGGSLADRLKNNPPDFRASAEMVETLARAVHSAHERGIVHRDLKPSNVMLAADGTPKIADFGLAKRLDDDSGHTHTGEILGTPSYMSPEQAEGHKQHIGPATDVYALGAILYELLTRCPPFEGPTPLEALRRVANEEPRPPTRINPNVPRDLEAICLKCLEKSPRQRYGSALALADDLRRYLNGQTIVARRTGPVGRLWKWARRHPQWAAFAAALVLIAIGFNALILTGDLRADREVRRKAEENAPLVRAILERNCWECHGRDPKKIEKSLDILNHHQLLEGARRVVVPGKPLDSRLLQRIEDGSMPPEEDEERLPRLTEAEVAILRDWIAGGAPPLPPHDPKTDAVQAPVSESAVKAKAILHKHCYECHSHDQKKGGIKILHHRLLVNVRKVVIPGEPDNSELFQLLTTDDNMLRMPPDGWDRLSKEEIADIRQWITEGAPPFPRGR